MAISTPHSTAVFPEKKTEKSDNIVLYDVMKNQEIGENEIIAANMHVIVMRTPQKHEAIELTYNPKLTGENTLGQQQVTVLDDSGVAANNLGGDASELEGGKADEKVEEEVAEQH